MVRGAGIWINRIEGAGIWRSWVQHVGVKVLVWGYYSLDYSDLGCWCMVSLGTAC